MKWVGGTIAGVFLGLFLMVGYIFFKSGSFKKVVVSKVSAGPFIAMYQFRLGPYHESAETLFKVEKILKKFDLLCSRSFGLYLDNPNEVDEPRLRSELGCLFDQKYKKQLENAVTESKADLKIKFIDSKNYIVGVFEGSPALVSLKVYPKLKQWAKENRYKLKQEVLEIYEVKSSTKVKTSVFFEII